jgi:hypothetical protein
MSGGCSVSIKRRVKRSLLVVKRNAAYTEVAGATELIWPLATCCFCARQSLAHEVCSIHSTLMPSSGNSAAAPELVGDDDNVS